MPTEAKRETVSELSALFASSPSSIVADYRGLTEALATQTSTLDYVKKVESTVRFYGEGESAILDRLKKDGPSLLDAFVAQEQIVLRWNSENPGQKLVAVYPVEGSLWADHPLALLERYSDYDHTELTNPQRDTYYAFARYLLGDGIRNGEVAVYQAVEERVQQGTHAVADALLVCFPT